MIDENLYAFGIDISRYDSANSLMDFKVAALHEPFIRFIGIRAAISWGYKDPFFDYHWEQAGKMHEHRINSVPVGRMAYHVLYPSQPVKAQVDNLFAAVAGDWEHDRLVIDAELDQEQSRSRITAAINEFGEQCRSRTGRLPILYSRYYWLRDKTIPDDLLPFDMWLAQYKFALPYPLYTPEFVPPPRHFEDRGWLAHQTGDRCKPIGVTGKTFMDYNRWNGGDTAVADYFHLDTDTSVPATIEERLTRLEKAVFGG